MRLIDADKLMEDIIKICKCQPYLEGMQSEIVYIQDVVDEQPTAFDIDDILRQCKDKAIQLMNKQYNEDEHHMFSKGVQVMYLAIEKIVKEGGIDE